MNLVREKSKSWFLFFISLVSIASVYWIQSSFQHSQENNYTELEKKSIELTRKWFDIIIKEKLARGIHTDALSNIRFKELLGNDFTPITTTLGSLEAKEISTDPGFAAIIFNYLSLANVDSTSTVGFIISGSFPALAISTLAALQTIGANIIIFSSLGASSYGANQPEATWIDYENWLIEKGGLKYKTSLLTYGAENDNGEGITEEGIEILKQAAIRNKRNLFMPQNLLESVHKKTDILISSKIDLLINIGGNQASMGSCVHSLSFPTGLNKRVIICNDVNRGIISRISELKIPFVHLLNINNLALENGLYLNCKKGFSGGKTLNLYNHSLVIIIILVISASLYLYFYKFRYRDSQDISLYV